MNPASSVAQSIFLFLLAGLHCFKGQEIWKTTQKRASNPHVKNALVCYFTYLHWITHDSDKNIEPTNPKPSEGWDQLSKDIMEKHLAYLGKINTSPPPRWDAFYHRLSAIINHKNALFAIWEVMVVYSADDLLEDWIHHHGWSWCLEQERKEWRYDSMLGCRQPVFEELLKWSWFYHLF